MRYSSYHITIFIWYIDFFHPLKQSTKINKEIIKKIKLTTNHILLPWPKNIDPKAKVGSLDLQP